MYCPDPGHYKTKQYHWVNRVLSLSLELITIALFMFHGYKMCVWLTGGAPSSRKQIGSVATANLRKLSHIFTILTLLAFVVMGGNYALS